MAQETCRCNQYATSFPASQPSGRGTVTGSTVVAPGRPVVVEVYLLRCRPDGLLAYRCATGQLNMSEDPDEAAARIGKIPAADLDPVVAVHSTSWRHLGDGSIVLAYAVAPDPGPALAAIPIKSFEIAHGRSASRPSPLRVRREQVAAHAARHLALVADTSPQVRLVLSAYPELI